MISGIALDYQFLSFGRQSISERRVSRIFKRSVRSIANETEIEDNASGLKALAKHAVYQEAMNASISVLKGVDKDETKGH
jgi:hypothetical protein